MMYECCDCKLSSCTTSRLCHECLVVKWGPEPHTVMCNMPMWMFSILCEFIPETFSKWVLHAVEEGDLDTFRVLLRRCWSHATMCATLRETGALKRKLQDPTIVTYYMIDRFVV